jgi:Flp pilus assembly protein TadG
MRAVKAKRCERARRAVGGLRRLGADRQGAAGVEFALTGTIFVALVLFVMALAFRLYVEVALDYASGRASRLLAVDGTHTRSSNRANFQSFTFCPILQAFLSCNNVTISLQQVTTYQSGSTVGQSGPPPFDPGQGGSLMLLQVTYSLPPFGWLLPGGRGAGGFSSPSVMVGYPYQNEY